MTSDNVTVLRCHDNVRLAKLITRKGDGELDVKGFDDARTFAWHQVTVSGLDDIQLLLEHLRGDPKSCVIRGEPREGVGARAIVNRRQHIGSDGSEPNWKHHSTGRRWLAFDLDKVAQDAFSEGIPTEEQVRAIVYQVRAEVLPQAFKTAGCVYKLSSSAGLYGWGKVSMHLWFWLDRPVHDLSLREYFKAGGFDISFSKAVQPHYTADPVFEGMTDPLAGVRLGRLPGRPVVEVPLELVDGDTWRQRDLERREAAKRDIEKRAKAAMADIAPSRAATRAYALKALQGACSDVLAAAEGTRHDQLIRGAYKMGGYCQPGFLDVGEVVQALSRTVEAVFPASRQRDELRTVAEMVEGGARQPLDLGHIGRKAPARLTVVRNEEPPEDDDGPQTDGALAVKAKPKGNGPFFEGVRDDGTVPTTLGNVKALLEHYGVTVRLNVMTQESEVELPASIVGQADMRHTTKLGQIRSLARRHRMQTGDALRDELQVVEDLNAYHPVADWIRSKPWDGTDRFEALLATVELKDDAREHLDLYRAMLWCWLLAGAKYATMPLFDKAGITAFGVLVLQGSQGCGKTQWIRSLAPEEGRWVGTGLTLDPHAKDDVMKVTRYWISELGEIDSTIRKADVGALKAFLTNQRDDYRRPYKEATETVARRTLFAASVNPQHFLKDSTGNRRFWVIPVERLRVWGEDGIKALDMQQLWAQFAYYASHGAAHHLPPKVEHRQMELAERHRSVDPVEDEVKAKFVVDVNLADRYWLTTAEIYRELYPDRELDKWTSADKRAVGAVLSQMGATRMGGRRGRIWSVKRVL